MAKAYDPVEFKAKWLKALRSGRYKQATGILRRRQDGHPAYCCLGVACNLINPNVWRKQDNDYNEYDWGDTHGSSTELPFLKPTDGERLSVMNDNGGTFAEIADYIEASVDVV
jgi:hypothetical protein